MVVTTKGTEAAQCKNPFYHSCFPSRSCLHTHNNTNNSVRTADFIRMIQFFFENYNICWLLFNSLFLPLSQLCPSYLSLSHYRQFYHFHFKYVNCHSRNFSTHRNVSVFFVLVLLAMIVFLRIIQTLSTHKQEKLLRFYCMKYFLLLLFFPTFSSFLLLGLRLT